ncbi:dTDP-glucose 4,6-dehydratase [Knoellia sinensis KCTC 19936]|uniref:dTDP-glucose 4,6-dehydratase n=1 Tax=Knoellia sinensis KCTC 19936 TaxID=1385520 RepID=A0A0A0JF77_9MICO|nr:nucleoside-diphosphate sugar epimerase/dehydratase [Knoellia sinensis]KGN34717.1 dTDP-glucose 4,6-dehydratase [Knoellia sinensis KCTC 19936]
MSRSQIVARRSLMIGWDAVSWLLALVGFTLVRHEFTLSERMWAISLSYVAAAMVLQVIAGLYTHLYLGRSKVGSFAEVSALAQIVLGISIVLGVVGFLTAPVFSRGLAFVMPMLAILFMAAGRWVFRTARDRRRGSLGAGAPALVYGAGDAGDQLAALIDSADDAPYSIVGFIDDDPSLRYLRVRGYRVLGRGRDLVRVAQESGAEVVVLAITQADPQLIQDVADRCTEAGLELVVVPPVREMISGRVELDKLRAFNVADLLGRRPIETDLSDIADHVAGKVVLVTGAGGSIGSELARQVRRLGPAKLILLDRDESALHATKLSLDGDGLLDTDDTVLCDIRDKDAVCAVFQRLAPEVVFHAAALKHLPMLERFPEEGWKTNVLGSLNVLECAARAGVQHFVNISTDKAADATSVLGQTKRLAERLTAWYAADTGLTYLSVRFGNVLGSRGSVLDTFRAQIERGGPVTVTDPDVTRYFMTIPEACELVLQAAVIGHPGDVLVLDMGEPVRIVDVAQRLIAESGKSIEVVYSGLREGEKLHEVLLSESERGRETGHELITQVSVPQLEPADLRAGERVELDLASFGIEAPARADAGERAAS